MVSVRGEGDQHTYQLILQDSGPGMTSDQIEEIGLFRQFGRKQNEQQGLGLGLAISQRLVEIIGGQIIFGVAETKGLKVTIRIPLMEGTA